MILTKINARNFSNRQTPPNKGCRNMPWFKTSRKKKVRWKVRKISKGGWLACVVMEGKQTQRNDTTKWNITEQNTNKTTNYVTIPMRAPWITEHISGTTGNRYIKMKWKISVTNESLEITKIDNKYWMQSTFRNVMRKRNRLGKYCRLRHEEEKKSMTWAKTEIQKRKLNRDYTRQKDRTLERMDDTDNIRR